MRHPVTEECQLPMQRVCMGSADGYCEDSVNTYPCNYDGGDCCGPNVITYNCYDCQCLESELSEETRNITRDYSGESFSDLINECIEVIPAINLSNVMNKLMYSRDEFIEVTLLENGKIIENWEEGKKEVWTAIFHPEFGYCHIFDLNQAKKYKSLPASNKYQIITTKNSYLMYAKMSIHETQDLASPLHPSVLTTLGQTMYDTIKLQKTKILQSDPPLNRLPCIKESNSICHTKVFHKLLSDDHKCKSSIFNSGRHLDTVRNQSLPECINEVVQKVMTYFEIMFLFFDHFENFLFLTGFNQG